jgi:hypothetical protein
MNINKKMTSELVSGYLQQNESSHKYEQVKNATGILLIDFNLRVERK